MPADASVDSTAAFTAAERNALVRSVATLLIRWGLGSDEACRLLGGIERAQWHRFVRPDSEGGDSTDLTPETALRAAHLITIHALLKQIFGDFERTRRWIHQPNARFADTSPLELMLNGELADIERVRAMLAAECA